ncbi:MAG: hypothetical protein KAJ66_06235, partial [Candidatus Omnitrophica bacterium]|nr:hypothetical protein [Candidatus Omnitrophota bacterium]
FPMVNVRYNREVPYIFSSFLIWHILLTFPACRQAFPQQFLYYFKTVQLKDRGIGGLKSVLCPPNFQAGFF